MKKEGGREKEEEIMQEAISYQLAISILLKKVDSYGITISRFLPYMVDHHIWFLDTIEMRGRLGSTATNHGKFC